MFPEIRRREEPHELELAGVSTTLARIYASRGVESASDLEYGLERLPDFNAIKGMSGAVELLAGVLAEGGRIVVVGDYDADGATSCAVAARALEGFGASEVHTRVPNRFSEGYGLTPAIVDSLREFEPALLMTVDNGIASVEGVAAARAAGMKVLVTDHHLPGPELPDADALINPNQVGDESGLGGLAGVGVVFLLMVALRAALREQGWFEDRGLKEPNLGMLLDLVALGTVADVVPLDHGNRVMVHHGVERIRSGRCQPGLAALAQVAGRPLDRLRAIDLGFVIGPRLNAAGRLEDMSIGVRCLLAKDAVEALQSATELDRLNRERRAIEAKMEGEALELLDEVSLGDLEGLPAGLCLFDPGWHQGIVGILASRIKERVHRPVIAFAPAEDGELRGSARSVPRVHIRDVIEEIAVGEPGLVGRFGGHAMAAGLSLPADHFERFREAFSEVVEPLLPPEERHGIVESDGALEAEAFGLPFAEELAQSGPWGTGFPEPVFDGQFEVTQRRIVGERHLKMSVRPLVGGRVLDAIAFRHTDEDWPPGNVTVEMIYRLEVNAFRGRSTPQLVVMHLRLV